MGLSKTAETGFAASAAYDANRPSYDPAAVDQLLAALNIKDVQGASVIDLAAGSGKFTEVLAARPEKFKITAVEPHAGLREQLASKKLENVKIVSGLAEDLSVVGDSSVAALVAAQSWHWFANMDALKEIHRVLEPTGSFGMIWNAEDYNTPKDWKIHDGWESTMRDVMWSLDDGLPRFRDKQWKKVFDDQTTGNPITLHATDPLFGLPIGESQKETEEWLPKQAILDRFKTYSQVANLDDKQLAQVEKTFWNAIDDPKTEVDAQGRVAVHNKVVWAWASKIPSEPLQRGGDPDD